MYLNLSAYQFKRLQNLEALKLELKERACECELLGTILIAPEGINMNLVGVHDKLYTFKDYLIKRLSLHDMPLKFSESALCSFKKMKVKLKHEIITFRDDSIDPNEKVVPHLAPEELKSWLDEGRDIIVLDTRNDYETVDGHFETATLLPIENFTELKQAAKSALNDMDKTKPIVTYCTGGVRCEKAGMAIEDLGFEQVYQLDGGILNYFEKCSGAHWRGDCFVFDDRHALTPKLEELQIGDAE